MSPVMIDLFRRLQAMALAMMVMVSLATSISSLSSVSADLSTLNSSMLATYYTPDQLCLLNESSGNNTKSEVFILEECRKKLDYSNGIGFGFQPTRPNFDRTTCCSLEKPLGYRDFDKVAPGFEDGNSYPLKDLFDILSDKNQSILLLGDSLAETTFNTMTGEIRRMIEIGSVGGVYEPLAKEVFSVPSQRYTPSPRPDGKPRNPVHIFWESIGLFEFKDDLGEVKTFADGYETDLIYKFILPLTNQFPDGLLILGNIGAHLGVYRMGPDPLRRMLNQKISQYILWLNDFTILNPKHMVFWRESFPAHFDSIDGSYEKWKGSSASQKLVVGEPEQDGYLYHCKPLPDVSDATMNSQAPENALAERILENWPQSRVKQCRAWSYFAPFWNLHCGTCTARHPMEKLDCLHQCGYVPTMWMPFWIQLVDIVSNYPQLTPAEETAWSEQKLSFGRTSYERTKDSRVIESDGVYYLIEFGVKRRIEDGRPAIDILFQRSVEDNDIASVSAQELSRIPEVIEVKPFLRDDTVINEIDSSRYFVMKNMARHEVRDLDTVQTFMERKSIPQHEVRHIPKSVLELIPLGESTIDI
jgi:hypothetical protein